MYHIIYPIFFNNERDQRLFWAFRKDVWEVIKELANDHNYQTIIFTDDKRVKTVAQTQGLQVYLCPKINSEIEENQLFCNNGVLDYIFKEYQSLLSKSNGISIVNFRSPEVTANHVNKILGNLKEKPGIWVALNEPEDHPAQLRVYLETIEIELHMQRDPEIREDFPAFMSKAFQIYLPSNMNLQETSFLRIPPEGLCPDFEKITKEEALKEINKRTLILESTPEGLGKRILGSNIPWPTNAFIPFGGHINDSKLCIQHCDMHNRIYVYIQPLPVGLYKCSFSFTNNGEVNKSLTQDWWVHITDKLETHIFANTTYIGPIVQLPWIENCDGILVIIEHQISEGSTDTTTPVIMNNGGWDINRDNILINTKTNLQICGRQDFPEVLEFDNTLIAASTDYLPDLQTPNFIDGAYGYRMPRPDSVTRALSLNFSLAQHQKLIYELP